MTQTWVHADLLARGRVRSYDELCALGEGDDVQRGEVGVEIDPGTGVRSSDAVVIYGTSLPGIASGLEQLARAVREAATERAHPLPSDNPRLARILKLNRAQYDITAVLREHFTADELGGMFDLLPDKQGQPFDTLAGALGTAWAEAAGEE